MNEMNIREGPPVVMLTTFIGHNLFSFFTLKKETGKAAPPPPIFLSFINFFLRRLSFQVDDNKLSESFLSFFWVWPFFTESSLGRKCAETI